MRAPSRTDAILAALMEEIEARRGIIDADNGLRSIRVTIQLRAGATDSRGGGAVRAVVFAPESERVVVGA